MGFWVISPSYEYCNGGPMKQDLTSHVGPTSMAVSIYIFLIQRNTDSIINFYIVNIRSSVLVRMIYETCFIPLVTLLSLFSFESHFDFTSFDLRVYQK